MAFSALLILAAAMTTQPSCSYDADALVELPFAKFDQDLAHGWRALQRDGCAKEAAEVLRLYRDRHHGLTDIQRSLLSWHEGQVWALIGENKRAIPLMLAGKPPDDKSGFGTYVDGTIAFLQDDRLALIAARTRLAAMPKPDSWRATTTIRMGERMVTFDTPWPPNLNVLDGLIACFGKPYAEAYLCNPLNSAEPDRGSPSTKNTQ